MSKIEGLTKSIESLSKEEQEKLINKLLEKMTTDEIKTMLERAKDNQELVGILKTIEPVF